MLTENVCISFYIIYITSMHCLLHSNKLFLVIIIYKLGNSNLYVRMTSLYRQQYGVKIKQTCLPQCLFSVQWM